MKSKVCTKCLKELPIELFAAHKDGKYGKQAMCRQCDSKRGKEYLNKPGKRKRRAETTAKWYVENKLSIKKKKDESWVKRRALHLAWEANRRAKRKGISFELNENDIADIQKRIDIGYCELTGTPLSLTNGRNFNSPSIDRIDCSKGYAMDNIRIVCHLMNAAMSDWGEEKAWEVFQNWQRKKAGASGKLPGESGC